MKKLIAPTAVLLVLAAAAVVLWTTPWATAEEEATAVAADETTSYALGYQMGSNLGQGGIDLDVDVLLEGIRAGLSGEDARFTDEQMQAAMMGLQQRVMAAQQAKAEQAAAEAEAAGAAFLDENAEREGVEVLESGLQYEVVEQGEGASPAPTDTVTVHYTGTLPDGTVFDSSRERGQPASFRLDRVVPGFSEGLQLMKPGATYKLYIPSELGYGPRAQGPIPANSALVFEVELIDVESAESGAAPQ